MSDLWMLANRTGLRPRAGATPADFAQAETVFGTELPGEVRELWTLSDGMATPSFGSSQGTSD